MIGQSSSIRWCIQSFQAMAAGVYLKWVWVLVAAICKRHSYREQPRRPCLLRTARTARELRGACKVLKTFHLKAKARI